MDTLLNNQDWAVDPCGNPVAVSGWEEEQQRCMIRLQVPKGAFPYQPELGSGLHALAAQAAQMTRADCARVPWSLLKRRCSQCPISAYAPLLAAMMQMGGLLDFPFYWPVQNGKRRY